MAYAAVTCLKTTIMRLLNSSRISVVSSTRKILKFVHKELCSLQEVLQRSDGSSLNPLDRQIIKVVQNLEDSLDTHEFNSQSQSYGDGELKSVITSSMETVKKIKQQYRRELDNSLPEEEADDNNDHDEEEEEEEEKKEDDREEGADGNDYMVKLSDWEFNRIKQHLVGNRTYVFSIVGMAGIGKTALAKTILQDPVILMTFECRAFFSIGQIYQSEKMKKAILAQVNPNKDKLPMEKDDRSLNGYLKKYLDDKRYLIVLDDVWSLDFWYDFFKDRRRDETMGSCILLTTRLQDLALLSLKGNYYRFDMPFLDKVQSWDLLRTKVFAGEEFPRELVNPGKKIAEKCDGLPLMVVTVAEILSKVDRSEKSWNEEAHRKSVVFQNAYDQILKVLYPSYYNLPAQVRTCFLYMAAFPPNHEVRRSKLVNLWCTEEFLEPNDSTETVKSLATKCFDKLNYHHVVVPAKDMSSDLQYYRACTLHSVFRHLCEKELENNGFLHIIQSKEDGSAQTTRSMRRVCIYYNVLLSNNDVHCSIKSSPSARSLLCTGAYHKYEVRLPVNTKERLLRVCDALTIRFFKFPSELLEVVQLRYFAITCHENLPTRISQLWKLEYLIVHQHVRVISTVEESYVPVEVWELQELVHLQVMGRNLPNPPHGVKLEKLVKLLDVGTYTCTEGVLTSMPNLQKLRVQIELPPDCAEPDLSNLQDNIPLLTGLLSLQCLIANPVLTSEILAAPSLSMSPSSVTKLTLSGFGYPWEYLNKFAKLPHLKVLKLLCYAFQGETWEVEEHGFLKLVCLSIEDSDLVHWELGEGSLPRLSRLTVKGCYNLQEFSKHLSFSLITLVDCNPSAVISAKKNRWEISSSWDEKSYSRNYVTNIFQAYEV